MIVIVIVLVKIVNCFCAMREGSRLEHKQKQRFTTGVRQVMLLLLIPT